MEWRCRLARESRPRLGEKLGRKKEAAILALLSQRNVEEAARAVGVTARTLYRWMKEPEFDAAYRAARRAAFSQSTARLQQMCTAAVSTLGKIMVDANAPAASRVRAADSVLGHAAKAIEIEDIEVRVSELERAAERNK
jgi:transposase-like protein